MILGVLSDLHGSVAPLLSALDLLSSAGVDEVLFAGDAFSDHWFSNETVEALQAVNARYVLGNHEMTFLGVAGQQARSQPHVKKANVEFVASRPKRIEVELGGCRVLMVHASPFAPYDCYLTPHSRELDSIEELGFDLMIVGHSHQAFSVRKARTLIVNPGSLGRSDDPAAGDSVSFATIDTRSGEVTFTRLPNPLLAGQVGETA